MGYPHKNDAFCLFLWITSSKRKRKAPIRELWTYSSTTTNASGPAPQSSHSKSAGSSVWPSGNSYTQSQTVHLIFITVSSFYLLGTTPIIVLSIRGASFLGCFFKFFSAIFTGNQDLALSLGGTHFLIAFGTMKINVLCIVFLLACRLLLGFFLVFCHGTLPVCLGFILFSQNALAGAACVLRFHCTYLLRLFCLGTHLHTIPKTAKAIVFTIPCVGVCGKAAHQRNGNTAAGQQQCEGGAQEKQNQRDA